MNVSQTRPSSNGPEEVSENLNYVALVELFEQKRPKLIRAAVRITRNQDEAEDVVQEAALRALLNLHAFRGESRLDTWICAIIANSAINEVRKTSRRRGVSINPSIAEHEDAFLGDLPAPGLNPEQCAVRSEIQDTVRAEIAGLKPVYRSAVQLCDLEGRSYLEAARSLGLNLPKFKGHLFRGRRALRQRLREHVLRMEAAEPSDRQCSNCDGKNRPLTRWASG